MHPQMVVLLEKLGENQVLAAVGAVVGSLIGLVYTGIVAYKVVRGAARRVPGLISHLALAGTVTGASVLGLTGWVGYRAYSQLKVSNGYEDFILAADRASDPVKAQKYVDQAVVFLDTNGMNEGYTSLMWPSPDEDLGDIYSGLIKVQSLFHDPKRGDYTDKPFFWREALRDHGVITQADGKKPVVVVASGTSVHPNGAWAAIWGFLSSIGTISGGIWTGLAARAKYAVMI